MAYVVGAQSRKEGRKETRERGREGGGREGGGEFTGPRVLLELSASPSPRTVPSARVVPGVTNRAG